MFVHFCICHATGVLIQYVLNCKSVDSSFNQFTRSWKLLVSQLIAVCKHRTTELVITSMLQLFMFYDIVYCENSCFLNEILAEPSLVLKSA